MIHGLAAHDYLSHQHGLAIAVWCKHYVVKMHSIVCLNLKNVHWIMHPSNYLSIGEAHLGFAHHNSSCSLPCTHLIPSCLHFLYTPQKNYVPPPAIYCIQLFCTCAPIILMCALLIRTHLANSHLASLIKFFILSLGCCEPLPDVDVKHSCNISVEFYTDWNNNVLTMMPSSVT